jgi:hypothetical protein
MTVTNQHSAKLFVFFPAVAMLLGWGLRGYIGGGPFGALMPGCFVALCLCLLLGYRMETAAMAALFGAIGVGYGGEMTYGQTLGFLHEPSTVYWGLLGCLLKGGIWGLFGGAVLGVGLTQAQYSRKTLAIAFTITVIAFFIGVMLINDPKLVYFSNRLDKPRDESWAGLLFAAIAFLVYLRKRGTDVDGAIPLRFALWGCLGGALGFAGGALWMVIGPKLPIDQRWIGWWKMMEFSFGFIFGAALGYCAWRNRERLSAAGQSECARGATCVPLIGFVAIVVAFFVGFALLGRVLPNGFSHVLGVLIGFVFFGAVSINLGSRSVHTAWQIAITLTFFHTVLDFVRDFNDASNFGYEYPISVQLIILFGATAVVGFLVFRLYRGERPVQRLLLLALWSCYLTGCARSFYRKGYLNPPEGENALSVLLQDHPGVILVHGVFTVSALLVTWFILFRFSEAEEPVQVA